MSPNPPNYISWTPYILLQYKMQDPENEMETESEGNEEGLQLCLSWNIFSILKINLNRLIFSCEKDETKI